MIHINARATPINHTDYSFHINSCRTCLTNCMGSISCQIPPLAINSLEGGGTHTHAHTHAHAHPHTHTHAQRDTHIHTHKETHMHTYRCLHRNNYKKPGMHRAQASTPGIAIYSAPINTQVFIYLLCFVIWSVF